MAHAERTLSIGFDTNRADVSGWIGWEVDAAQLSIGRFD